MQESVVPTYGQPQLPLWTEKIELKRKNPLGP